MNRVILIRIDTTEPARLTTAVNAIRIQSDDVETEDDALYLGGGLLLGGLPDIDQLINGTASRVDINVSGVTAQTVSLALEEAEDVKGSAVNIGVLRLDEFNQIVGVEWVAQYRADKLKIDRSEGSRSISLSMGSDDTGRSRASNSYWTQADQFRRSPDDIIFDHVSGIHAGTSRTFGPS